MSWEKRLRGLMVCAAVLSLGVCPATAAQVRSFTDAQGVIQITNVGEAPEDAETPKESVTPTYQRVSHRYWDTGLEPPGNASDKVPSYKHYKVRKFLGAHKIILPN